MARKKRSKTSSKPSKKYVSSNTKYYKHSSVGGTTGHVNRVFRENKNAFAEHSHLNFGDTDFYERYRDLHSRKERETGKKARKDATTYCESVLSFSVAQYDHIRGLALQKHVGDEKAADKAVERVFTECFEDFQQAIKDRFGLEPVGFNMHLDEGHINEAGNLKKNVHGHVGFYNYDFKKGVSPWRHMGKKELSEMQDIADRCFKKLGFERGLSAEQTKRKHLEKDEYIKQKKADVKSEIVRVVKDFNEQHRTVKAELDTDKERLERLQLEIEREQQQQELLRFEIEQEKERLEQIKQSEIAIIEQFKEKAEEPFKVFQKFLHSSFNYVRSLLQGRNNESLKRGYESSKKQVEERNLSNQQKMIFDDINDEIRVIENPRLSTRNKNILKY